MQQDAKTLGIWSKFSSYFHDLLAHYLLTHLSLGRILFIKYYFELDQIL